MAKPAARVLIRNVPVAISLILALLSNPLSQVLLHNYANDIPVNFLSVSDALLLLSVLLIGVAVFTDKGQPPQPVVSAVCMAIGLAVYAFYAVGRYVNNYVHMPDIKALLTLILTSVTLLVLFINACTRNRIYVAGRLAALVHVIGLFIPLIFPSLWLWKYNPYLVIISTILTLLTPTFWFALALVFFTFLTPSVHKTAEAGASVVREADDLDQLAKCKQLLDMGVLTPEEYETKKKQLLHL